MTSSAGWCWGWQGENFFAEALDISEVFLFLKALTALKKGGENTDCFPKHKSPPLQDDSEVCITDAQSLDRLSLQSQEELEEVNLERYLQVVSAVIMSSSFFTTRPSSPLWSSPLSQPGCRPRSKLVEGLWLSARWSHRSSEVHRLPTAGVQVRIFALGLRILLLFCVLPLWTSFLSKYNFAATKTLCSGRLASAIGIWRKVRVLRNCTWPGWSFLLLFVFKIPSSRLHDIISVLIVIMFLTIILVNITIILIILIIARQFNSVDFTCINLVRIPHRAECTLWRLYKWTQIETFYSAFAVCFLFYTTLLTSQVK